MLRRPPTVLTLTSEDVKAYEDHREAEAFQHATAAAQLRRQQQLARNMSGMDITGITTSSDEEDYSEQEASYYPNRTYSQNARISREENIEGPPDEGIYRNEGEDSDDYEDASEGGGRAGAGEEAFIEDEDMAEAEHMDLDADQNDNDEDNDIPAGGAVPNLHHTRRQQHQQEPVFPSPPPAPSRMTRSTRSASTEPSSSQATQQHHQQQQQQPAPAGRFPRGAGAPAQTHRRAPSGRAAAAGGPSAEATTPTPVAQAQRDAADRVRARATRSRDERIGVARGGRR